MGRRATRPDRDGGAIVIATETAAQAVIENIARKLEEQMRRAERAEARLAKIANEAHGLFDCDGYQHPLKYANESFWLGDSDPTVWVGPRLHAILDLAEPETAVRP